MILVFDGTQDAIAAERLLEKEMRIELMPTPTSISAGCGIVIRVRAEDARRAREILEKAGRPFRAVEAV